MYDARLFRLLLTLLLAVVLMGGTTACEISLGDAGKTDDAEDDGGEKKKKKKKRKKKKKKDEDDDDSDEDSDKKAESPKPAPEPQEDEGATSIRISSLMSGTNKLFESEKPAAIDYRTVDNTGVQIPLAPGWKGKAAGLYTMAIAPDGDALLAFTTVGSRGELTGRLKHVERIFSVKNYQAEGRKEAQLGPDKLKALFADGSCNFGTTPGDMAWVLIDTGARRMVLVIVAGKKTAAAKTKKQALSMVYNMRKKR